MEVKEENIVGQGSDIFPQIYSPGMRMTDIEKGPQVR
jgi:hypothetical protein